MKEIKHGSKFCGAVKFNVWQCAPVGINYALNASHVRILIVAIERKAMAYLIVTIDLVNTSETKHRE